MTRLKFCPVCQHHFTTRMTHIVCSVCRSAARRKAQLRQLAPAQIKFVHKLQKNGYGRTQAIRAARGIA